MRLVTHVPATSKASAKRLIIATNPQSTKYVPMGWVILFGGYYTEGQDGPAMMVSAFPTIEEVFAELEEINPGRTLDWQEYPDQVPDCEDDWLGPVRKKRDESGSRIPNRWERLDDGKWVEINQSSG